MEVITSFLHSKARDFPIHFVVYYSFAGLIIVSIFILYGKIEEGGDSFLDSAKK
jgi:uncharacterized membrane protein